MAVDLPAPLAPITATRLTCETPDVQQLGAGPYDVRVALTKHESVSKVVGKCDHNGAIRGHANSMVFSVTRQVPCPYDADTLNIFRGLGRNAVYHAN